LSRPQRLLFPPPLIEASTNRMRVQLRRTRKQFEQGTITRDEARNIGEQIINESYDALIQKINDFVTKKGVTFGVTGVEPEMQKAKTETVVRWNRIVDDLRGA
jgi:hypothetical protein